MPSDEAVLKERLEITDLVLIELMKSDENFSEFRANVDLNVPSEVKNSFGEDSKKWQPRLVAERAKLYCKKHQGVDIKALDIQLKRWLFWLLLVTFFALLLVFVFHIFGATLRIFSSTHNEASIFSLMWLIFLPPLFWFLPLIGCCIALVWGPISRWKGRHWLTDQPESSLFRRLCWILKHFSIPGLILGARHQWRLWKAAEPSKGEVALERFANENGHIVTILFVWLSNLFVLLLNISMFISICFFLIGNEVNYSWKSSLQTTNSKKSTVAFVAQLVPFVTPPSDKAIEWAIGTDEPSSSHTVSSEPEPPSPPASENDPAEEQPTPKSGPLKNKVGNTLNSKAAQSNRIEWSNFLLCSMFVLGILPRLVIFGLSVVLVGCAWFELMPKGDDPEVEQIVDNVMGNKVTSTTETKVPELVEPIPVTREEDSDAKNAPTPPQPKRPIEVRSLLAAYSLPPGDLASLSNNQVCQKCEFQNVEGAEARQVCVSRTETQSEINRVIIAVLATTVPDGAFSKFMDRIAEIMSEREGHVALIVLGAREHLARVDGDTKLNRQRIDLWKREAISRGIEDSEILIIDLDSDAGNAQLENILANSATSDVNNSAKPVGKFREALTYIENELNAMCESEEVSSSKDWEAACDRIREHISQIYANEYRSFVTSLTNKNWKEKARAIVSDLELPDGMKLPDGLCGQFLAMNEFLKSLSPRWMIAGAIAGMGASAAIPLLVGGAASLPLLVTVLPYTTIGGGVTAQFLKTRSQTRRNEDEGTIDNDLPSYEGMNLDITVRALLLLVVMLEYQNNPHHMVVAKVEQHLGPLERSAITTQQQMGSTVAQLRSSLSSDLEEMK